MTSISPVHVEVAAPARLHLGFLDLQGGFGRRFGSVGLTIGRFETRLSAQRAEGFSARGPSSERAVAYAVAYTAAREIQGGVRLTLHKVIPEHAGLGSGTQMALAVGMAIEQLYGSKWDARAIAQTLNRGMRSGIGIGAFEDGGFIVDCGRGEREEAPPIALRLPFPERWRILLLFDQRSHGLHGTRELDAFARLPEFPAESAGRLCRLLLMKLVPGVLGEDLAAAADAVGEIQRVVGSHFAPAQGGCFSSPAVAEALAWAERKGLKGSGQSSWGPTGFVLVEDEAAARRLERDLKRRFGELSPLRYEVVSARNRGASVEVARPPFQLRRER